MPVHAAFDLVSKPPREVEEPFVLAARRVLSTWLETRDVVATADDVRLAEPFLRRLGLTIELLPGRQVRVVSQRGRTTVMSREDAVLLAIRSLVALEAPHSPRTVARAA